jgi:hypothetical protein
MEIIPPKDEVIIPAENQLPEPDEEPVKKTRKKRVTKDKPQVKKLDNSILARQLVGVHAVMATLINEPMVMLDEESEAKPLADAIAEVLTFYDLAIDPKHAALLNLAFVAGAIYVPKIILIKMAKKDREAEASQHRADHEENKPAKKEKAVEVKPVKVEDEHDDLSWLNSPPPIEETQEVENVFVEKQSFKPTDTDDFFN